MKQQAFLGKPFLLFFGFFVCLLPGMGLAPFFLEEPRRGLVAMEMLFSHDFFHTTIHGEPYYNKPPLFNWVMAIGFTFFGFEEWVPRMITLLSHLITGLAMFKIGKRFFDNDLALISSGLYLVGVDILFYFSFLGEIDIFFSAIIFLGWCSYFHFSEKQNWLLAFIGLYFFMALGFLTKGLPAMLFLGFTLLTWHGFNRNWKLLFTLRHFLAISLFALLIGAYFMPFFVEGDWDTLLRTLWNQSVERTSKPVGFGNRILTVVKFPFLLWLNLLPGSILILFFWKAPLVSWMKQNRLFCFSVVVLLANIWIYWISPESRSRYLYMFHPLCIWCFVYAWQQHKRFIRLNKAVEKFLVFLPWLMLAILFIALWMLPFYLPQVKGTWILFLSLLIGSAILWFSNKYHWDVLFKVILFFVLIRLPFGSIISQSRSSQSSALENKQAALQMAKIVGSDSVYLLGTTRISYTTGFYLQKALQKIVPYTTQPKVGNYLIVSDSLRVEGMQPDFSFSFEGVGYSLVKLTTPYPVILSGRGNPNLGTYSIPHPFRHTLPNIQKDQWAGYNLRSILRRLTNFRRWFHLFF